MSIYYQVYEGDFYDTGQMSSSDSLPELSAEDCAKILAHKLLPADLGVSEDLQNRIELLCKGETLPPQLVNTPPPTTFSKQDYDQSNNVNNNNNNNNIIDLQSSLSQQGNGSSKNVILDEPSSPLMTYLLGALIGTFLCFVAIAVAIIVFRRFSSSSSSSTSSQSSSR